MFRYGTCTTLSYLLSDLPNFFVCKTSANGDLSTPFLLNFRLRQKGVILAYVSYPCSEGKSFPEIGTSDLLLFPRTLSLLPRVGGRPQPPPLHVSALRAAFRPPRSLSDILESALFTGGSGAA